MPTREIECFVPKKLGEVNAESILTWSSYRFDQRFNHGDFIKARLIVELPEQKIELTKKLVKKTMWRTVYGVHNELYVDNTLHKTKEAALEHIDKSDGVVAVEVEMLDEGE